MEPIPVKPGADGQPIIKERTILVVLKDDQEGRYTVRKKKYPRNLPTKWIKKEEGKEDIEKQIEWISCFGLVRRDSGKFEGYLQNEEDHYYVVVPDLKDDEKELVYFTGVIVKLLTEVRENTYLVPDGDPPIGISTG